MLFSCRRAMKWRRPKRRLPRGHNHSTAATVLQQLRAGWWVAGKAVVHWTVGHASPGRPAESRSRPAVSVRITFQLMMPIMRTHCATPCAASRDFGVPELCVGERGQRCAQERSLLSFRACRDTLTRTNNGVSRSLQQVSVDDVALRRDRRAPSA